MDDVRVFTGTLVVDLVMSSARTLKDRRAPLRSLVQKLRNQDLAVAQVGEAELVQRAFLAVTAVSGCENQLDSCLDAAERIIFASDFEVADLRRLDYLESFPSAR